MLIRRRRLVVQLVLLPPWARRARILFRWRHEAQHPQYPEEYFCNLFPFHNKFFNVTQIPLKSQILLGHIRDTLSVSIREIRVTFV